jgi:hypothetical protein
MKLSKRDLMVEILGETCYRVLYRKRFLYFISLWYEMTDQETENSPEQPIEFKTLEEAVSFCEYITS